MTREWRRAKRRKRSLNRKARPIACDPWIDVRSLYVFASMIFSENRCPLFKIMLSTDDAAAMLLTA
jgi:hypothetical protein